MEIVYDWKITQKNIFVHNITSDIHLDGDLI